MDINGVLNELVFVVSVQGHNDLLIHPFQP